MVPRPRTLAGILGAALLFTGLVTALAIDGDREDVLVGAVPLPRHGDEVTYVSGNPDDWRVARWVGTNTTTDAYGRPVEADVVEFAASNFPHARAYFEPGHGAPFAVEQAHFPEGAAADARVSIAMRYDDRWAWDSLNWHWPCLVRSGWQGLPLQEIPTRSVAELCPELAAEARDVRPMGTDVLLGRTAQRFTFWNGSYPALTVWLTPDLPYPLAAARCTSARAAGCNGQDPGAVGILLHRYEPGEGAALLPASDRVAAAPVPQLAAFTRTGPEDAREDAFTLQEAVQRAEADATLTRFQEWRRAHPEARIVEVHHIEIQPRTGTTPSPGSLFANNYGESWQLTYQGADETRYTVWIREPTLCERTTGQGHPLCPGTASEGDRAERTDFPPRTFPDRVVPVHAALELLPLRPGYERAASFALADHAGRPGATWYLYSTLVGAEGSQEGERDIALDALTGRILHRNRIDTATPITGPGEANAHATSETHTQSQTTTLIDDASLLRLLAGTGTALGLALLTLGLLGPRLTAATVVAYTRLTRSDVLDHPHRARLLHAIRQTPGLTTRDAETLLGIGSGATRHHLETLVRAGELARHQAGGYTRYYIAGSADHHQLAQDAIHQAGRAEARLLQRLHERPGIHPAELARDLGITRAAVHQTLRRLQRRGLITQEKTLTGRIHLHARR